MPDCWTNLTFAHTPYLWVQLRSRSVQYAWTCCAKGERFWSLGREVSVLHGLVTPAGCHSVTLPSHFAHCPINCVDPNLRSPYAAHSAHRTLNKQHNRTAVAHIGVLQRRTELDT